MALADPPSKPSYEQYGNGTSQGRRALPALDPAQFPVDGRTLRDALNFALAQGRTLPYFDSDDREAGNWGAFIAGASMDPHAFIDEVIAFIEHPERYSKASSPLLFRPHFTLFLVFLQLFGKARAELDTLTRRHLDFYYRQFLRLVPKGPVADRVHVFFELAAESPPTLVPAGSRLSAGQDRLGRDLVYATDRDLVVRRAQIAQLSSVFVQRNLVVEQNDAHANDGTQQAVEMRWAGLTPALDATSVRVEADGQPLGWKTFGQPSAEADPPRLTLGWAVATPLLALAEGRRTITLTFTLRIASPSTWFPGELADDFPMRCELSTRDGWREVSATGTVVGTPGRSAHLEFTATLDASFPPIEPNAADPHGIAGSQPALRLMLKNPESDSPNYDELRQLEIENVKLEVTVEGLAAIQIQNDAGPLDAASPFEPFGSAPTPGARFYWGHPELATKRLTSLAVQLVWMGLPEPLDEYYKTYGTPWNEGDFAVTISAIDDRVPIELAQDAKIFTDPCFKVTFPSEALFATGKSGPFGRDLRSWQRYFVCTLKAPDFGHEAYPSTAAKKAIELALALVEKKTIVPDDYIVHPPYTPKLEQIVVNYTAALEDVTVGTERAAFFHVHPFGHSSIPRKSDGDQGYEVRLVPDYPNEGELYIGLRGAESAEVVSLLVQMAEGCGDPHLTPPPVQWSELQGNEWRSLNDEGAVQIDTTRGLTQSGLVQLNLSDPGAEQATLLPGDLRWLRAAVSSHTAAVCDTIAMHTQATSAIFVDQHNAAEHYDRPLPPSSIQGLSPPVAAIARVEQPYTSRGGRPAETSATFDVRVSERLRHKDRALTPWDYERLVLEEFPEIYKARCLHATPDALGKVRVVVIPDVRAVSPRSVYEPRVSTSTLAAIREHLERRAPSPAVIQVVNPDYVQVKVRARVRFSTGGDEQYFRRATADALKRYLSPWAYDDHADITIGSSIYVNSVVHFVERLPYVNYVTQLFLMRNDGNRWHQAKTKSHAGSPTGVLTTAPEHVVSAPYRSK